MEDEEEGVVEVFIVPRVVFEFLFDLRYFRRVILKLRGHDKGFAFSHLTYKVLKMAKEYKIVIERH